MIINFSLYENKVLRIFETEKARNGRMENNA
jgi:hypothetical protein